jgi:hypothetical protein
MFARVATFENVDVSRAPEVSAEIRKTALPMIQDLSGWSGHLTLVDTDARRVTTVTFFQTREDAEAAEPTFEEMPKRLPDELREIVAGTRTSVSLCDVAIQEGVALGEHTAVGR